MGTEFGGFMQRGFPDDRDIDIYCDIDIDVTCILCTHLFTYKRVRLSIHHKIALAYVSNAYLPTSSIQSIQMLK